MAVVTELRPRDQYDQLIAELEGAGQDALDESLSGPDDVRSVKFGAAAGLYREAAQAIRELLQERVV